MARAVTAENLPFIGTLDRGAGDLSRQLAAALRVAIRRGDVRPGELIPSSRALARALRIARGTVVEAFEQLIAEGFLESRRGASTWVTQVSTQEGAAVLARSAARPRTRRLPEVAATFTRIAEQFSPLASVPFAISIPTGATAPGEVWRRLGNRIRARGPAAPAGYSDAQGALPLREAIAGYVRRSRAVRCDADQVIITSGTQQGLYLCSQVLVGLDDATWVENPAYPALTAILSSTGRGNGMARVRVDDEGLDVDHGRRMAAGAVAAFVTPSHQYPLGMPMTMRRREALVDWARHSRAWIVEDDYDSEMRYSGHPFPSLQGLDPDRVVYLGTFSKVLFPSLRLGYAIVPRELIKPFCGARILMDRHAPTAEQHVLAAFIGEGHLDRHIRRMRSVYAEQRSRLVKLLDRYLPTSLGRVQVCDQGMHMVVWLGEGVDDREIVAAAADEGVALRPVSPMYAPGTERSGLLLGFGGFSDRQLEAAVVRLVASFGQAVLVANETTISTHDVDRKPLTAAMFRRVRRAVASAQALAKDRK